MPPCSLEGSCACKSPELDQSEGEGERGVVGEGAEGLQEREESKQKSGCD